MNADPHRPGNRSAGCPSEFALERLRFGEVAASPEEAALAQHVGGCEECRRLLAELAATPPPPIAVDAIWARAVAEDRRGVERVRAWLHALSGGVGRGMIGGGRPMPTS